MTENEKTLHGQQIPIRPKAAAKESSAAENGGSSVPGAQRPGRETAQDVPQAPADATVSSEAAHDVQPDDAAEVAGELSELVKVAAERDEYLALAQRTQADFENYRKRMAREAAAAQERGIAGLAKELLPALDNLDRALEAADVDDPLLKGVRLVRAELASALSRAGIESFSPGGEVFDPALHEAVATAPQGPDGAAAGTVVEVYQDGYRLGESILRPARVVVAA